MQHAFSAGINVTEVTIKTCIKVETKMRKGKIIFRA